MDFGEKAMTIAVIVFFRFWNKICSTLLYEMNPYSLKRRNTHIKYHAL